MIAEMNPTAAWTIWLAILLISEAFDAIYCGMETGAYVLNKIRLDLRAEKASRPARLLQRMLSRPNNFLTVLLIGTNLSRYLATFSIASMFVLSGYGEYAEWYTLAVATPLLFVLGDAVPKNVFRRLAETLMYRLAWFLKFSNLLFKFTGISLLVRGISAALLSLAGAGRRKPPLQGHPLSWVLAEGRASGVLTHFQSVMADRVMNIADVTLADVMVPMRKAATAPQDVGRAELVELIRHHNYSRMPMLDEADRVVGVLDIYDVLADGEDDSSRPAEKMTPPLYLPAGTPVTDALYQMQREHSAMAVVEGEDSGHIGIVTIKDLVEEIVGELEEW